MRKYGLSEIYLFFNTVSWHGPWWYGAEGSLVLNYTNDQ
jgi:hypothetical protein